jgi:hypothetical protein
MLCERLSKKSTIKEWRPHVWENLGWHHSAISGCGRISVHQHHYGTEPATSTAFLGEPNSGTGRWAEHGKTPEQAVKNVILVAKNSLAEIGAAISGL